MSFAVFLYNVSVIISNLQRYIIIIIINKLTSNTKSVIYKYLKAWHPYTVGLLK